MFSGPPSVPPSEIRIEFSAPADSIWLHQFLTIHEGGVLQAVSECSVKTARSACVAENHATVTGFRLLRNVGSVWKGQALDGRERIILE